MELERRRNSSSVVKREREGSRRGGGEERLTKAVTGSRNYSSTNNFSPSRLSARLHTQYTYDLSVRTQ